MKKTKKIEYVDFDEYTSNNPPTSLTATDIKKIKTGIFKSISHVEKNEIEDLGWGYKLNKKHCENKKRFAYLSKFTDGEEIFLKYLKDTLFQLEGLHSSAEDEIGKEELNKYINFFNSEKNYFDESNNEKNKTTIADNTQSKTKNPVIKNFPEYLLHANKSILASKLKSEFSSEKGKGMHLMLKALEERKNFSYGNKQRKNIFNSMRIYFNRNIGTYQSIFDFKYSKDKDELDYNSILQKVDFILANLKNNK